MPSSSPIRKRLDRHIAQRRAIQASFFAARGRLLCKENLFLLAFALVCASLWLSNLLFAADPQARTILPFPDGQLIVAFLDIGQGDSIFIQTPDKRNILIDAGPGPDLQKGFSAGRDRILPFFQEHGIHQLDAFVMSHAHADHIGGLPYILESIPVQRFYDPGFAFTSPLYLDVLETIEKSAGAIDYQIVKPGDRLDFGNEVAAQILAPPRPYISGSRSDANANSLVLRLAYGRVSILLPGDAEEETEHDLAEYGDGLRSTFLKAAHHGSRYASSKLFLDLTRPLHVFVSCGRNNLFGHPHEETLKRYAAIGAKVHRTDRSGHILLFTDGKRYKIVSSKPKAI